jgi:hypothetical protein
LFLSSVQTLLKFGKYIDNIIKKRESESTQKSLVETKADIQKSLKSISRVMSAHNTISRDNSFTNQLQTDVSIASIETSISQISAVTSNRDGTNKVFIYIFSNVGTFG